MTTQNERLRDVLGAVREGIIGPRLGMFLAHYLMDITDDALYQSIKDREKETHKYLKIDESNVYINDEIGEYLTKCGGWDNSEFHYFYGLDGDVQTI